MSLTTQGYHLQRVVELGEGQLGVALGGKVILWRRDIQEAAGDAGNWGWEREKLLEVEQSWGSAAARWVAGMEKGMKRGSNISNWIRK